MLAIVPTFRPDPTELTDLVATLLRQDVPVLLVDDGSPCTSDEALRSAHAAGAAVLRHPANEGIARGLNDGLRAATQAGARWLLTVDQDSDVCGDYIERLMAAADRASEALGSQRVGAVAAGSIADASGGLSYPVRMVGATLTTPEVIQTGTLWDVQAMTAVGGFDETLGIDAVDAAACLRLRQTGRSIVLAEGLTVHHRLGDGRQVRVLGRSVLSSGHHAQRRTTMVRNRLRLFPAEFAQDPVHALRTIRRVAVNTVLAVTIEDDRWAKAKASARGLIPSREEWPVRALPAKPVNAPEPAKLDQIAFGE